MSHSDDDNFSDEAVEGYPAEFQSYLDDAWYNVRVLLEGVSGDKLRVKHDNFTDDHDNVFDADSFKSEEEICEFIRRFRKTSSQLQDTDCSKVEEGMRVCAADVLSNGDVRFYDAIVDNVLHKMHSNVNGQEECECSFLLYWLQGPNVGNISNKGVADICLIQGWEIHPKVASFMEKIEKALCGSVSGTSNDLACNLIAQEKEKGGQIVRQKPSFARRLRRGKCAQRSLTTACPYEGGREVCGASRQEDTDVGGEKNLYIILVQNLEKELSSSTASEFIHKQTSIAARVHVFPSLPWEPYTKGIIMLDCQKDLEWLFVFLQNPNHFIVSLNGRPWVATEKKLMKVHWALMLESPNKLPNRSGAGFNNELKVVCYGTEEYNKAKKLRDLFLQFIDHQRGLFKRLSMEERSIS